jgi:UDP-N-acetylmuramate--alanine ligase
MKSAPRFSHPPPVDPTAEAMASSPAHSPVGGGCLEETFPDGGISCVGPGARVHLIGAGGCGMSGLAHLLLDLGCRVAGSDLTANAMVEELRVRGAALHTGHSAAHLADARPDLVVYSSAVAADNPELLAARTGSVPTVRRAVLLAALMRRQRGICVAGMHGKTTTTSLLAFALEQLGARPSYAIGAQVPQLVPHARWSAADAPWFVAEADESDGTLSEYRPEHAIVLNVDEEHLDHFANLEAVCRTFTQFARQTADQVVFCADDPRLVASLRDLPRAISYGFSPDAAYRIEAVFPGAAGTRFDLAVKGRRLGEFATGLVGRQNVANAAAVVALLHQLGYAPEAVGRALAPFRGAKRRQDILLATETCRIWDDYGHHPTEIRATLRALKDLGPQRLLVVFQPHRHTRTKHLLEQFATCFKEADLLWLTEIYAAGEPAIPGVSGAVLAEAVRRRGQAAVFCPTVDELPPAVASALRPGDWVLFLGAGNITQAAHALAARLRTGLSFGAGRAAPDFPWQERPARLTPQTAFRRGESLARHPTEVGIRGEKP